MGRVAHALHDKSQRTFWEDMVKEPRKTAKPRDRHLGSWGSKYLRKKPQTPAHLVRGGQRTPGKQKKGSFLAYSHIVVHNQRKKKGQGKGRLLCLSPTHFSQSELL